MAFAEWAGGRLPSETEWEVAAQGLNDSFYVWGDTRTLGGTEMANTWQGIFPIRNTQEDGYVHRAPVGCYEPNQFGLYDMIGNVWEWSSTPWSDNLSASSEASFVIKGGSFLCAENYCRRYRASARQPQEAGLPTNHIGFRIVQDIK